MSYDDIQKAIQSGLPITGTNVYGEHISINAVIDKHGDRVFIVKTEAPKQTRIERYYSSGFVDEYSC